MVTVVGISLRGTTKTKKLSIVDTFILLHKAMDTNE